MADGGFAGAYGVELLLERVPQIDKAKLLASLNRQEKAQSLGENSDSFAFSYPEYSIQYDDVSIPPQFLVAVAEQPLDVERIRPSVEQSWDWPEAKSAVERCRATVLVTDLLSSGLEYQTRLRLFHNSLLAVLEQVDCIGIHWQPSQRIVAPLTYVESKQNNTDKVFPAINVRLFRVENREPDEILMDSIGLAALGLSDVQCHFFGMDTQEVARVIYNSAHYIFENGDVIQNGHTIQGLDESQKWKCQYEDALIAPQRVVLDFDAGIYAAGNRSRG